MKKLVTLAVLLLAATALFASGQDEQTQDTFKVGFVFTGPIADGGWTQQHNAGRLAVEDLGVETLYKESVPTTRKAPK